MLKINIGETLTCAETGKQFVAAADGCSFNYARTRAGETLSDEGVHLREVRGLLDRSRPFACYVSCDGKSVTGWKGNILGTATVVAEYHNNFGATLWCYRVTDAHGAAWRGRNSGPGMIINLYPVAPKEPSKIYIQRRGGGYLETVDEFTNRAEARCALREYRLSDSAGSYYLSQRACKSWDRA